MGRFGVLTGGGDCPGLNAVIRAIVRRGNQLGHEFFGYRYGWAGVLTGDGAELTDVWPTPLAVGQGLPTVPLALNAEICLPLDLEDRQGDWSVV